MVLVARHRLHEATKKWAAYIKINGKKKHLGYFADEDVAVLAWAPEKWAQEGATRTTKGWSKLGEAAQLKRLVTLHPKGECAASGAALNATQKRAATSARAGWNKLRGE